MPATSPNATTPAVIVVEDERLIQELLQESLGDAGFVVSIASTSGEAIGLLEADALKFRALVTDVRLASSKLTGWDVARRAREMHPELPVVYITGDSGHEWSAQGVPNSIVVVKPFAVAQVVTAIAQLLNAGGASLG